MALELFQGLELKDQFLEQVTILLLPSVALTSNNLAISLAINLVLGFYVLSNHKGERVETVAQCRKFPLFEIRNGLLKAHENFMRLHTDVEIESNE